MGKRILPAGTVDFHTHILGGVDHGSQTLATSVAQWRLMQASGLSAVVATPHFYAHEEASVETYLARRDAAAHALFREVRGESDMRLYLGAEVLVFPGLEELPDLEKLTVAGTDIILLEMPLGGWSHLHLRTVSRIASRGLTPLLAHLNRYSLHSLDMLYDNPAFLFQVNLSALLGFGAIPRYFRRMLKAGAIAALGSDLHGTPKDGYDTHVRAFLKAGAELDTVNAHTSEMLAPATPFSL